MISFKIHYNYKNTNYSKNNYVAKAPSKHALVNNSTSDFEMLALLLVLLQNQNI